MQNKAWLALNEFVGNGRAGWGVWCVRGSESTSGSTSRSHDRKGKGVEGKSIVRIDKEEGIMEWKVYCWGAVVPEIWLLLYLVSEKAVRGAGNEAGAGQGKGARWIDADGVVVVAMDGF